MVNEYHVYQKQDNYDFSGKWKKYMDIMDYTKDDILNNGIDTLAMQHDLIKQIPINRIQKSKKKIN